MLNWLKTLPARTLALLRAGLEKMKRGSLSLLRPGLERIKRDGPPLFHAGLERVKRVDLSPARSWLGRGKRDGLQVGVVLTVVYILLILVLWGSEAWALAPNELGDFLAGVFTPLALGWLVYGYFLQTRELGLQRQELALTRDKLGEQVELLKKRDEAEYQRSLPRLKLEETGSSGKNRDFQILNIGGAARELELVWDDWDDDDNSDKKSCPLKKLETDERHKFTIPNAGPPRCYYYKACFFSDGREKFYQHWEIRRTGDVPPFEVEELTNEPTPLEEA